MRFQVRFQVIGSKVEKESERSDEADPMKKNTRRKWIRFVLCLGRECVCKIGNFAEPTSVYQVSGELSALQSWRGRASGLGRFR
jgi:hypothetical protein